MSKAKEREIEKAKLDFPIGNYFYHELNKNAYMILAHSVVTCEELNISHLEIGYDPDGDEEEEFWYWAHQDYCTPCTIVLDKSKEAE